jgi:chromosome partitioning protein
MVTLDRQLGAHSGKGLVLASTLQKTHLHYDYVLIDCPPLLGVLMVNALAACERLIIPVQTEFLAIKGLERIINTLMMINRSRQEELDYTIVPTFFDKRTRASIKSLDSLKDNYQDRVWDGVIPIDTQFREASTRRVPLPMFIPKSRGSLAYEALLDYLLGNKTTEESRMLAS